MKVFGGTTPNCIFHKLHILEQSTTYNFWLDPAVGDITFLRKTVIQLPDCTASHPRNF